MTSNFPFSYYFYVTITSNIKPGYNIYYIYYIYTSKIKSQSILSSGKPTDANPNSGILIYMRDYFYLLHHFFFCDNLLLIMIYVYKHSIIINLLIVLFLQLFTFFIYIFIFYIIYIFNIY